jgi:hypothetical protein
MRNAKKALSYSLFLIYFFKIQLTAVNYSIRPRFSNHFW